MSAQRSRSLLRECLGLLLIALLAATATLLWHPNRPEMAWVRPEVEQVSFAEIASWKSGILWVDARSSAAYRTGHIPEAVSVNEDDWHGLMPAFLERWQPEQKIVVYCDSGQCSASTEVAGRLKRELNLSEIYVLQGDWKAWQATSK